MYELGLPSILVNSPYRLVFTCDGVIVGVDIYDLVGVGSRTPIHHSAYGSVGYDLVKTRLSEPEAEAEKPTNQPTPTI